MTNAGRICIEVLRHNYRVVTILECFSIGGKNPNSTLSAHLSNVQLLIDSEKQWRRYAGTDASYVTACPDLPGASAPARRP